MNLILAVCGSIASYKSYDIARSLVKNGHCVRVVLTHGALEFIRPETFRYLGVEAFYLPQDDFKPEELSSQETVLHIELARWADKLIIAPLSANTLGRLALGLNNDLLGSLYLALGKKPVLFFPAMNTQMLLHGRTKEHLASLANLPLHGVVAPSSGLLACGEEGEGKLPEVQTILDMVETFVPGANKKEKILITAGATVAPLDPVRYLTNPSSGKMGLEVAKAFLTHGYQVELLAGHGCTPLVQNLLPHPNFKLHSTPTTASMRDQALALFPYADLYVSTGAIADIEFETNVQKLKKEQMVGELKYHLATDILAELLKIKKSHQKVVSFAAETDVSAEVFKEKMKRKPVDLMVGNPVSHGLIGTAPLQGFQLDEGEYFFIQKDLINGPLKLKKAQIGSSLVKWFEGDKAW